jgi:hypothetical protein
MYGGDLWVAVVVPTVPLHRSGRQWVARLYKKVAGTASLLLEAPRVA